MNRLLDLRLAACALAVALAGAAAWHAHAPRTYVASARVMLAQAAGESRILKLESAALDPAEAQSRLAHQLAQYSAAALVDAPTLVPSRRSLALDLALGGGVGLAFGAGLTFWQARRRQIGRASCRERV